MSVQVAIYDRPGGVMLADWTGRIQDLHSATGEHGFLDATGFVPMALGEAARWYSRPGVHLELTGLGGLVWEGRLEDPQLVRGGFAFKALGYWSTTRDVPFTGTYAGPVASDQIVRDVRVICAGLQVSEARITSSGFNVYNEVYADVYPDEIFQHLALLGTSGGERIEVGVWEDRYLHFRPRGSAAREWVVDVADPEVERSLSSLYNQAYTVYKTGGVTTRTATNTDLVSQAKYGVTRQAAVKSDTTNATQATTERDAYLQDHKDLIPRAKLQIDAIYTPSGTLAPLYGVRAGDRMTIRNLPPTLGVDFERVRSFVISATDYDWDADRLSITPEAPPATLDVLIARSEESR